MSVCAFYRSLSKQLQHDQKTPLTSFVLNLSHIVKRDCARSRAAAANLVLTSSVFNKLTHTLWKQTLQQKVTALLSPVITAACVRGTHTRTYKYTTVLDLFSTLGSNVTETPGAVRRFFTVSQRSDSVALGPLPTQRGPAQGLTL